MNNDQSMIELFVPGRVCLFGEHSDWAGTYRRFNSDLGIGRAIVVGTNQGIYAKAHKHPDKFIYLTKSIDGNLQKFEIDLNADSLLKVAQEGGFFSYIAGVAYQIMTHYKVQGAVIDNYCTDLPLGKGLSSSAAVCVLVTRAFNRLYDLKMTSRGEMEYAYRGEITTPSRCGRLDQACAFNGQPISMTFDGDQLMVDKITVKNHLHYVIVDLMAEKNTIKILSDLNKFYPFTDDLIGKEVQKYLGQISLEITDKASHTIDIGEPTALGLLMKESQNSFDLHCQPASPDELKAPILHHLISYAPIQAFILGIKGIGSHGDGCAQILTVDKESQKKVMDILKTELSMESIPLDISPDKAVHKVIKQFAGEQFNAI
jgi:mevalonate kinase